MQTTLTSHQSRFVNWTMRYLEILRTFHRLTKLNLTIISLVLDNCRVDLRQYRDWSASWQQAVTAVTRAKSDPPSPPQQAPGGDH